MPTAEYGYLLERISLLDAQSQINLLADLAVLVRDGGHQGKRRDIMEFMGIAKGTWKDIDVQEYIDRERNSWDS